VGWAMNASHAAHPPVPAHRVVNRNGLLTGKMHFGSPTLMEELLDNEGIKVVKDQVQDFQLLRWRPLDELPDSIAAKVS
jgi:methylated-DNA-protein-cysteine methyltransferase related protein